MADHINQEIELLSDRLIGLGIGDREAMWADEVIRYLTTDAVIDLDYRIRALEAVAHYMVMADVNWSEFDSIIPVMFYTFDDVMIFYEEEEDDEFLIRLIVCYTRILERYSHFFGDGLEGIVYRMFKIFECGRFASLIRTYASDFIAEAAKNRDMTFVNELLFKGSIRHLCAFRLDADWQWQIAHDNIAPQTQSYVVGMHGLRKSIGAKSIKMFINEIFPKYMDTRQWECKLAGLTALSQLAVGHYAFLKGHLDYLMPVVVSGMMDNNDRVRFEAISVVGVLYDIVDLGQEWKDNWLPDVITPLGYALDDHPHYMVQAEATNTARIVIRNCEPMKLTSSMDMLVRTLAPLLEMDNEALYNNACNALTCLAAAAGLSSQWIFSRYYTVVQPHLMHILMNEADNRPLFDNARIANKIVAVYLEKKMTVEKRMAEQCLGLWKRRPRRPRHG